MPAYNEADNLVELVPQVAAVLDRSRRAATRSSSSTTAAPTAPAASWPSLRSADGPLHPAAPQLGQVGRALASASSTSEGEFIVLMDADGQDDPEELPRLLARTSTAEGLDLVTGRRAVRNDRFVKRTTSKLYNGVTAKVTGVPGRDFNSGLKAMRRELADSLEMYGELHRYIPVLAVWNGFRVGELDVEHHERRHGTSKFGRARFWRGFLDLVTVKFLTTYTARPFHLFGGIGFVIGLVGAVLLGWMGVSKLTRPRDRHPPGAAARRAARGGGRPDGVARPARRAHGEPAASPQPRRHGRGRPAMTRARPPAVPIGLGARRPRGGGRPGRQEVRDRQPGRAAAARPLDGPAARGARPGRRHRRRRRRGRGARPRAHDPAGTPPIGLEYRIDKVRGRPASGCRSWPARWPTPACCRSPTARPTSSPASSCSSTSTDFDPAVAELARITGGRSWCRCRGSRGSASATSAGARTCAGSGNDPEHVQAFTPGRLRRALERHYSEVRVVKAFPWLIAEARRPR